MANPSRTLHAALYYPHWRSDIPPMRPADTAVGRVLAAPWNDLTEASLERAIRPHP